MENKPEYNVIGDVAGNYKTLMALIEKMPKCFIVQLGDLMDRGPRSKEVVRWFMENQDKAYCLYGNHEDLCVSSVRGEGRYDPGIWEMNGGDTTLDSFDGEIPADVVEFLATRLRRLNVEIDGRKYLLSHAFPTEEYLENGTDDDFKSIWNRQFPVETAKADVQITGHNSHYGLRYWGNYGICIDTSRTKVLTGIHIPTMTIYQQEYID